MTNQEPEQEITPFAHLVLMLSSSAMQQMQGLIQSGEGDLEQAQAVIDILDDLATKTRGNLSKEESRLIQDSLTALKMAFVQVSDKAGQAKPATASEPKEAEQKESAPAAEIKTAPASPKAKGNGEAVPHYHKSYG